MSREILFEKIRGGQEDVCQSGYLPSGVSNHVNRSNAPLLRGDGSGSSDSDVLSDQRMTERKAN